MSRGRVLVAMSGGVDSSVAAALLVEQGYEVIGVTMQVWDYSQCNIEEGAGTCCSSEDVDDARAVADRLGLVDGLQPGRKHLAAPHSDHVAALSG